MVAHSEVAGEVGLQLMEAALRDLGISPPKPDQ